MLDQTERHALYVKADELWDANANTVWICYITWYYAAQARLRMTLRPDGLPVLFETMVV